MKSEILLETERLILRRMTPNDFDALCGILKDPEVMYAYEGAFDDDMVRAWLENQMKRYEEPGMGLNAVILKETGGFIGQCGLTRQSTPDGTVTEIGYLLCRDAWHNGYATEAGLGCRGYAFEKLGEREVFSIIRDTNTASQNVAKRLGMEKRRMFVKHYRGVVMPHFVYSVRNDTPGR